MASSKDTLKTHERLARIEERLKSHIDEEGEVLEEVAKKLDRIELELSRYRGVIGGILFVSTALVTFLKLFWDDITRFIRG